MPRYFFHLRNRLDADDPEGRMMPDADTARAEAIKDARSVIASEVLEGRLDLDGWIEIVDETGDPVLTVTFRDAVSE